MLFVTWLYVCTHATSADLQAFKVSFLSQRLPFLFLEWKGEKQTMFKRQLMCKIIRKRVIINLAGGEYLRRLQGHDVQWAFNQQFSDSAIFQVGTSFKIYHLTLAREAI